MKKLKLPILKNAPENNKWLSMDEYIKFLNFNAELFGRKGAKKTEDDMPVNVPFRI